MKKGSAHGIVRALQMRRLFLALLFLLIGSGLAGAADEKAPPTADGKEELPEGLPPAHDGQMKMQVLHLMRDNRIKYGPDAALMQGLLLTHSLQGDAVLTTESTLVGFEEAHGRKWVTFRVASGVVLDDRSLDRDRRLERIWHIVVERTLLQYPTFTVPADGVAVEVGWNHRPYKSMADLYAHIDDVGPVEQAKFYLSGGDVTGFLEKRLGAQELLERSRILFEGAPVKVRLVEPPPKAPTPRTH